jgi:GNAT superfamily N-acetyltransferase
MLQIRFEQADHSERPAIMQLWQASYDEWGGGTIPNLEQVAPLSRVRFLLLHDGDTLVGMAGVTFPTGQAQYCFEIDISFPHDAIPCRLRSQVAEGLGLYVKPAYRQHGAAQMLSFLVMLTAADAGATLVVLQNTIYSLGMVLAAGFVNTGIVTKVCKGHPVYLTVGQLNLVCPAFYRRAAQVVDIGLSEELVAMLARWREQN